MKIALVHCAYTQWGGEDAHVQNLVRAFETRADLSASVFLRSSSEFTGSRLGLVRAAQSCFRNEESTAALLEFCARERPDIVHVHNLYPVIPPSALLRVRDRGIRIVMTLHNFRLVCPNALLLSHGDLCERCLGGREYWCVIRNCERSLAKSALYAVRGAVARHQGYYHEAVDVFLALTRFQRDLVVRHASLTKPVHIVGSFYPGTCLGEPDASGDFVGFAGRLVPEKGPDLLIEAARRMPTTRFVIAGDGPMMQELRRRATPNVSFWGMLKSEQMAKFYSGARIVVCPSKWYEGLPTVLLESFCAGKPCIVADLGGMKEVIEESGSGITFRSGDAADLERAIRELSTDERLAASCGAAAARAARERYSADAYLERLLRAYRAALQ